MRTIPALVCATLLLAPLPLTAHHSRATFDTTAEVTMKGTVTDWLWFNPHCILRFDVTEENGTTTNWAVETSNPTDISQRGWSRGLFRPGDEITVTLQPSRNGAPVGHTVAVVTADGRKFE